MAEYAFNDKITFKANINNVQDTLYTDSLYRGHYAPGAGRVVLVTLSTKF